MKIRHLLPMSTLSICATTDSSSFNITVKAMWVTRSQTLCHIIIMFVEVLTEISVDHRKPFPPPADESGFSLSVSSCGHTSSAADTCQGGEWRNRVTQVLWSLLRYLWFKFLLFHFYSTLFVTQILGFSIQSACKSTQAYKIQCFC